MILSEHSILSPSGASAWTLCHGKLAACKHITERSASIDSARGTLQHKIGETCLTRGIDAIMFLGTQDTVDGFDFTVTEEMCKHVQMYVDGVRRSVGRRYVEFRLDTSPVLGVPGQQGTADAIVLNRKDKCIEVHDAKFGFHKVTAKDNKQGIIYAAAALAHFNFVYEWESAKFVIHQPRIDWYDEWTYTLAELEAHMVEIRAAAALAYGMWAGTEPIVLNPGEVQCQWCPIRGTCAARTGKVLAEFPIEGRTPGVPMLNDAEVAQAYGRVDEIEAWCSDIRKEAHARAMAGKKLPGFKLIKGRRGDRTWVDEEKAVNAIALHVGEDKLYKPRKIASPADIEKVMGKKEFGEISADLVTQAEGSLKLVPEADKGAEVQINQTEFPTL